MILLFTLASFITSAFAQITCGQGVDLDQLRAMYDNQNIQIIPAISSSEAHIDLEAGGLRRALSVIDRQEVDKKATLNVTNDSYKIEAGRMPGDFDKVAYPTLVTGESSAKVPSHIFNIIGIHIEARVRKDTQKGLSIINGRLHSEDDHIMFNLDLFAADEEIQYFEDYQPKAFTVHPSTNQVKPFLVERLTERQWRSFTFNFDRRPVVYDRDMSQLELRLETTYYKPALNILNGSRIDNCVYFIAIDPSLN